jgi:hypothetical protein
VSMLGHVYVVEYRWREPVSTWSIYDVFANEDVANEHCDDMSRVHPQNEFRVREYTANEAES